MVDQSNLFEVIEFDPNTIGGLVVEHDKRDHLNLNGFNSNVKSLNELENFSSGGQEPISGNIEFLQLGRVYQKVKYVNAIMDVLLSSKQRGVVEEERHKKGPCIPSKGRRRNQNLKWCHVRLWHDSGHRTILSCICYIYWSFGWLGSCLGEVVVCKVRCGQVKGLFYVSGSVAIAGVDIGRLSMRFLSLNVRGLVGATKGSGVHDVVRCHRCDMVML
ncbi:hypothetical protein V6N13_072119 [Hibiscus sabdariffa]